MARSSFTVPYFIGRMFLAVVFVLSGVLKLQDPARFLDDVQGFQLLPYWMAYWGVLVLPWLEILCGFALLTWRYSAAAALILGAMTAGFIYMIAHARQTGLDVSCGCFGQWYVFPSYAAHLLFNLCLLLLLALSFVRSLRLGGLDGRERTSKGRSIRPPEDDLTLTAKPQHPHPAGRPPEVEKESPGSPGEAPAEESRWDSEPRRNDPAE